MRIFFWSFLMGLSMLLPQCGAAPTPEVIVKQPTVASQPGMESGVVRRVEDFTYGNVCYINLESGGIFCLPFREQ